MKKVGDDTAETAGENETDVQNAAAPAQSGDDEKPALTPLQQARYDYFAKWDRYGQRIG